MKEVSDLTARDLELVAFTIGQCCISELPPMDDDASWKIVRSAIATDDCEAFRYLIAAEAEPRLFLMVSDTLFTLAQHLSSLYERGKTGE